MPLRVKRTFFVSLEDVLVSNGFFIVEFSAVDGGAGDLALFDGIGRLFVGAGERGATFLFREIGFDSVSNVRISMRKAQD
jgi:hypothetical protein